MNMLSPKKTKFRKQFKANKTPYYYTQYKADTYYYSEWQGITGNNIIDLY